MAASGDDQAGERPHDRQAGEHDETDRGVATGHHQRAAGSDCSGSAHGETEVGALRAVFGDLRLQGPYRGERVDVHSCLGPG